MWVSNIAGISSVSLNDHVWYTCIKKRYILFAIHAKLLEEAFLKLIIRRNVFQEVSRTIQLAVVAHCCAALAEIAHSPTFVHYSCRGGFTSLRLLLSFTNHPSVAWAHLLQLPPRLDFYYVHLQ